MAIDYYEVLGVAQDAQLDVIKRQYRTLVRENHPDVAADKESAHARMQLILEAWNVLSDPRERARYDRKKSGQAEPEAKPEAKTTSPAAQVSEEVRRQRAAQNLRNAQPAGVRGGNPRTRLLGMVFDAQAAYFEGRLEEAISICNRVTSSDPTNAEASHLLGEIYESTGRLDLAVLCYEKAMRSQPGNSLYRHKWENLKDKVKREPPPPPVGSPIPTTRMKPPIAPRATPKPPPTGPEVRDPSFANNIRAAVRQNLEAKAEAEPAPAEKEPEDAGPSLIGRVSSWFKGAKK